MANVTLSSAAEDDLRRIARYIMAESKSRAIALDFLDSIQAKCELYATQPQMATLRPDLGDQIHTFPVKNYVVIYQPTEEGIRVIMDVHGARDVPHLMKSRLNIK